LASKPSRTVSGAPSCLPNALSFTTAHPACSRATASRSTVSPANRSYGSSGGGWLVISDIGMLSRGGKRRQQRIPRGVSRDHAGGDKVAAPGAAKGGRVDEPSAQAEKPPMRRC
jgi:hypothetical protein